MPITDQLKNYAKKLVEDKPDADLEHLIRPRKPIVLTFADDGIVPNNRRFPVLWYRGAINADDKRFNPATIVDTVFDANGWGRSWRDTVYDFVHYHSSIHEVLGVAKGSARLECGGVKGRVISMRAGDVVILPAGTGHRLIDATKDFLVVGAYPEAGSYDEVTDTRERPAAIKRIAKVRKPAKDPIYGRSGPLSAWWARTTKGAR